MTTIAEQLQQCRDSYNSAVEAANRSAASAAAMEKLADALVDAASAFANTRCRLNTNAIAILSDLNELVRLSLVESKVLWQTANSDLEWEQNLRFNIDRLTREEAQEWSFISSSLQAFSDAAAEVGV